MSAITVNVRLTPRDVSGIAWRRLLLHPASIFFMAAGPVFWLVGLSGGSAPVIHLGQTLSWLTVLIPAFALLVGSFAAYRPGTSELYAPVRWSFDEDGIDIEQDKRSARGEWSEFRSWRVANHCYLLNTTRTKYVIVPQRDVPEARRAEFEELLAAKLGARKR